MKFAFAIWPLIGDQKPQDNTNMNITTFQLLRPYSLSEPKKLKRVCVGFQYIVTLSLLLFSAYATTDTTTSQEQIPSSQQATYKESIQKILSGEEFNEIKKQWSWRSKNKKSEEENDLPEWLKKLLELLFDESGSSDSTLAIAQFFEIILWGLFIIFTLYMLYYFHNNLRKFGKNILGFKKSPPLPTNIAGLDISRESLPEDIVKTSLLYWHKNQYREAMGLLYRATLSHLVHDFDCNLRSSYTEQECYESSKTLKVKTITELMGTMTQQWLLLAYRHITPTQEQFENLCFQWQQVFTKTKKDPHE